MLIGVLLTLLTHVCLMVLSQYDGKCLNKRFRWLPTNESFGPVSIPPFWEN